MSSEGSLIDVSSGYAIIDFIDFTSLTFPPSVHIHPQSSPSSPPLHYLTINFSSPYHFATPLAGSH